MTHESAELPVWAEYHSDWHIYLDHPVQGPLGYCTGTDDAFDPAAATRTLAQGGWQIVSPWTETPPTAEAPYTATVIPDGPERSPGSAAA